MKRFCFVAAVVAVVALSAPQPVEACNGRLLKRQPVRTVLAKQPVRSLLRTLFCR